MTGIKARLRTKRLILTPMTDEALCAAAASDPDEHMRGAYGQMLTGCKADPTNRLWSTEWSIALRDTGAVIGGMGFKGAAQNGAVEIGYGLNEAYHGRGYATEAARAMIRWAFSHPSVYYVTAETEDGNLASKRVLEKLGFKATGEQGEEGPLFELERPRSHLLPCCVAGGLVMGVILGLNSTNFVIGTCIGVAIGVAVGGASDANANKARAECEAKRRAR